MTAAPEPVDSSSVDLGASSATIAAAPAEALSGGGDDDLNVTRPYEGQVKSIHGEEEEAASPSEVDLGARHESDSGKDFFEPSEALAEAPAEPPVDEELPDLEAADAGAAAEEDVLAAADEEPFAAEGEEELAPAEAAEEEPAEELAEEPEEEEAAAAAPAKKEKRRSTAGAWMGGLVLGGVVTAGVLLGLWLFKIEPPAEWRGFIPGLTGATTPPATNGTNVSPT